MKSRNPFALVISCTVLLLAMTALVPADAASFGRTTAGTITSAGLRADYKRGSKYVLQEQATVQQMCAYLDGNGSGTGVQTLRMALYRDRDGVPAELVIESYPREFTSGQLPAGWYCFEGPSAPLGAGTYWGVIHSGGDPGVVRYYYDGPANWYGNPDLFSDGSADTFGSGGAGEGTVSIRIDYLTESEVRYAGNRRVGSRVSQPMSAHYKRGSSFTLAEKADLRSLSAYIDGRGGVMDSQSLTLALYTDKNGEPSARVAWAPVTFTSPIAGRSGRWVTAAPVVPVSLLPGRYWLVLHSGSAAGVLRYYIDGQGNWRGSSNPEPAPTGFFGQASTGDGTISGFILYAPSSFVTKTFGRTTPGTIPSRGLAANFMRGSVFYIGPIEGNPVVITGLWAYLDGNGGASGSQKLRLAFYSAEFELDTMQLRAVSEEVTIAAGSGPRWVRFAIPYTRIFDKQHTIMIQSGGTAGVARNYASNEAGNWFGLAANYDQGPLAAMRLSDDGSGMPVAQQGDVTVSLYAEYFDLFPAP